MIGHPPRSTLFPYPTLFRSDPEGGIAIGATGIQAHAASLSQGGCRSIVPSHRSWQAVQCGTMTDRRRRHPPSVAGGIPEKKTPPPGRGGRATKGEGTFGGWEREFAKKKPPARGGAPLPREKIAA